VYGRETVMARSIDGIVGSAAMRMVVRGFSPVPLSGKDGYLLS
jgi:hypothetical protein